MDACMHAGFARQCAASLIVLRHLQAAGHTTQLKLPIEPVLIMMTRRLLDGAEATNAGLAGACSLNQA